MNSAPPGARMRLPLVRNPPGMPLGGVGVGVNVGAGPVGVLVGGFPAADAGLDIGPETSRANNIVTVASTTKSRRIAYLFISRLLSLLETFPISRRYELHLKSRAPQVPGRDAERWIAFDWVAKG
jgi:hypothetical protein